MTIARFTRRNFLRLAGALAASTAVGCADGHRDDKGEGRFYEDVDCPEMDAAGIDAPDPNRPFAERVVDAQGYALAYFQDGDPTSLEAIAAVWLDEVSPQRDEATLAPLFEPILFIADTELDAECAGAAFQELIRSQFAALEFVDVGGWTMSEGELTLAAIATGLV